MVPVYGRDFAAGLGQLEAPWPCSSGGTPAKRIAGKEAVGRPGRPKGGNDVHSRSQILSIPPLLTNSKKLPAYCLPGRGRDNKRTRGDLAH